MLFLQTVTLIPYPSIHPVLLSIGPVDIRWYSLAYVVGILLGWRYIIALANRDKSSIRRKDIDDFLIWAMLGIIIGGRIGWVLFYHPSYYLIHPHQILFIWQGGMSFHGGILGMITALLIFTRSRKIPFFSLADFVSCAAPIGLFLGRIANFINGELYGQVTNVPWAMIFPTGGAVARHPSQLYEAVLEGLLLFGILFWMSRRQSLRCQPGMLTGTFLCGYAVARIICEFFRQPDAHIGFLFANSTMGQLLSAPILLAGVFVIVRACPPKTQ